MPEHGYRRELDLTVRWHACATGPGSDLPARVLRQLPHQAIVGRLWADTPGSVSLTVRLVPAPAGAGLTVTGGLLVACGALADNRLRYDVRVVVRPERGRLVSGGDRITVIGADAVTLIVVAGTDYAAVWPHYRGPEPAPQLAARLAAVAATPYDTVRADHVADYRALADRVTLSIGQVDPGSPTDELVARYGTGGPADRWLEALHFAYGRYLLIASSRPGSLPANLQGVWNDSDTPAWSADYHTNINLRCATGRRRSPTWRRPRRRCTRLHRGAAGAREDHRAPHGRRRRLVVHNETNPYGFTGVHTGQPPFWFPEAAAWLCRHLWEHYLFTSDERFPARAGVPGDA